eukprot:TRINITY_DN3859_c0_g1_i4.p1 TRINITY_DN3859_c0_g1~~TRINITY_DN3859_c0_g1_i4.p1  ORF type:complete len:294 (+),score=18.16 TRINITY_DN3859_c0_g1_i4:172-1053(+)
MKVRINPVTISPRGEPNTKIREQLIYNSEKSIEVQEVVIRNFMQLAPSNAKAIQFTGIDLLDEHWTLLVYPNGASKQYEGHISVFIKYTGNKIVEPEILWSLSLKNSAGVVLKSVSDSYGRLKFGSRKHHLSADNIFTDRGYNQLCTRDSVCNFLSNTDGSLIFCITMEAYRECTRIHNPNYNLGLTLSNSDPISSSTLAQDLKKLLQSYTGDVKFKLSSGKELFAHQCILSTRSPVFAAMLSNGMKESVTKEINVEVNERAFEEILHFIYTDTLTDQKTVMEELGTNNSLII